jgi:hypothetical protein
VSREEIDPKKDPEVSPQSEWTVVYENTFMVGQGW